MDFNELLSVADFNRAEAKSEASVKRYSSAIPPPKKLPKSNVQSDNIRRFLEKKKAEEEAKVAVARKQREQLLALRAQNSKNNKKAKIMASRTKDNDFSKIKLTEDEIESKKKVEDELRRKNLADKVQRMKARIEMEEREKLLPKKRKRKSKNPESVDDCHNSQANNECHGDPRDSKSNLKHSEQNLSDKKNGMKKPPPPIMSFSELLKVAEKKQYEPVVIPVKKKEEEKLMTKKERKLMELEQERLKRKHEQVQRRADSSHSTKSVTASQNVSKKIMPEKVNGKISKKPLVIHVEKDSRPTQEPPKFKVPRSNCDLGKTPIVRIVPDKTVNYRCKAEASKLSSKFPVKEQNFGKDQKKLLKPSVKDENNSFKTSVTKKKTLVPKKNGVKVPVATTPAKQNVPLPSMDEAAIEAIERRIREKIEKEMELKLAAKFGLNIQNSNSSVKKAIVNTKSSDKVKQQSELNKTSTSDVGQQIVKSANSQPLLPKKDLCGGINSKKEPVLQKPLAMKPRVVEKKPFHMNPYLDPPRRLLEPQRPPKPALKRRIESDDEDDDDMSDFIDDGPSQNDEDYSRYIKEIFGYDRNKYADCDDDDIMESSYSEQMKEEIRSAKLGYLEDLEEERLQREMEKKRKKKIKK